MAYKLRLNNIFMKKWLAFFMIAIIVCGCKKASQPPPVGIFARINNAPWTATQYRSNRTTGVAGSHTVEWLNIFSSDSTSNTNFHKLVISVPEAKPNISTLGFVVYSDSKQKVLFDDGGIIFTLISTSNIQGTFRLNSDSVVITGGTFNVPVQ
jgi:hypothetical protein